MIPFNKPPYTGNEDKYIKKALRSSKISGDGKFTKKCEQWFENKLKCNKVLLTTSCTHALEMAALLINIEHDDEVIMPSYTFVSTANAFVLRGAKIVFVDIRPDTMNIDEKKIEQAITNKTKAIVPVHYAGVACEMDSIMNIAKEYNLFVIEDAAQGITSTYKGKPLGTIGHLGTLSFHETKNITSAGEGGLLIINDKSLISKAEIIREKGTNRTAFFRGEVDKYSWVDIGSSYLMSDISAAYLWGQIKKIDLIQEDRLQNWNLYYTGLRSLERKDFICLPTIPIERTHNAHMFYLKVKNLKIRAKLINYLKTNNIYSVFHYIPLHSSKAGKRFSRFSHSDIFTTKESEKLIRLPIYYTLKKKEVNKVIYFIKLFFKEKGEEF